MELLWLRTGGWGGKSRTGLTLQKSAFCHSGLQDLGVITQTVVLWTLFQARNQDCANMLMQFAEPSLSPAPMELYLFSINRHFAAWLLLCTYTWLSWEGCQYLPFSTHLLVTPSAVLLVLTRVIKGFFFSPQNRDKSTSAPKPNYQTWLECK